MQDSNILWNLSVVFAVTIWSGVVLTLLQKILIHQENPPRIHSHFFIWIGCILIALAIHTDQIVFYSLSGEDDSLFTLGWKQQAGLLLWSGGLLLATAIIINLLLNYWFDKLKYQSRFILLGVNLASSLFIFIFLHSISRQFYYFYYLLIFDNLEFQWVITSGFDTRSVLRLLSTRSLAHYSAFLSAISMWTILLFSIVSTLNSAPFNQSKINIPILSLFIGLACLLSRAL